MKEDVCRFDLCISLIPVPFWWNGRKEGLMEILGKYRPDVLVDIDDTS